MCRARLLACGVVDNPPVPIPRPLPLGYLPPFLRSPTHRDGTSPYRATALDLVERYAISKTRIRILEGLLDYRAELRRIGLTAGFQWIDGSFTETLDREPNDVDIVTFAAEPTSITASDAELFDPRKARARFLCDAWFVDLSCASRSDLVADVTYWFGLFSHQKRSLRWKGLIELELSTDGDSSARARLATLKGATS